MQQFVGIDWAYRRAAWCAKNAGGDVRDEGVVPADEDGLGKLVLRLGTDVCACVEMMSGAVWVRDRLRGAGWQVEVADARKRPRVRPVSRGNRVDGATPGSCSSLSAWTCSSWRASAWLSADPDARISSTSECAEKLRADRGFARWSGRQTQPARRTW